ncbi:hypothetical protein [Microbacterium sp. SLBN-111]|uniref:hypothetical protein n=1 Tax=Microbacterium sp. SLBN-111 TaxID=3377733 RepID=UPI003C7566B7
MNYRLPYLAGLQDIIEWADRVVSRSDLPNLARQLIWQTNDRIIKLDMGGDEEVNFGGYDGRVLAGRGTPFVPEGASVWEFSTSTDIRGRAQENYKKRTGNTLGVVPSETTFVFVTPRRWTDAEKWAAEKRIEGVWKDVVAFDAADIYGALENAPAAHIKFSEAIGKPANSVGGLEEWWNRYRASTGGLLTPELVLAGRADEAAALLRTLRDRETGHTWISATSIDDVLAFVASTLLAADPDIGSDFLDRSLVVYEPGTLRFLDAASNLLILLPFEQSLVREADLVTSHHVILHAPLGAIAQVSLPKIPVASAEAILSGLGVTSESVHDLALAAYRSIPLFRSRLAQSPTADGQALAANLASSAIARRSWLLGAWNSSRTGDAEVFSLMVGESDAPYVVLRQLSEAADPIFTVVGSTWKVISPDTHFGAVAGNLTSDDLAALEAAVQTVLGAVDPTLQVDAAERWRADLLGPARVHSSDIRTGIATTLAAFGGLGDGHRAGSGPTLRGWAELAVRALLERANEDETGQLWLSLTDVLPLLAEAAPYVFLDALECAIADEGPLKPHLFSDAIDDWSASSPHVHVLWALETLGWSADHLATVTETLARLAELDPGGKLSNRPANVLTNTFRPWTPQTSATTEDQIEVIRAVVEKHP